MTMRIMFCMVAKVGDNAADNVSKLPPTDIILYYIRLYNTMICYIVVYHIISYKSYHN